MPATLGIWGVSSFLDFRKKVDSGKAQIAEDIKNARDDTQNTRNDTIRLKADVDAAHAKIGVPPKRRQESAIRGRYLGRKNRIRSDVRPYSTVEDKIEVCPRWFPELSPIDRSKLATASVR